jgi:hypothetical protein
VKRTRCSHKKTPDPLRGPVSNHCIVHAPMLTRE